MDSKIRRGRPRVGDAPSATRRLTVRIPSRVNTKLIHAYGIGPDSLRLALQIAADMPEEDRVVELWPAEGAPRDESVRVSVVVPIALATRIQEAYGTNAGALLRAYATALAFAQRNEVELG